MADDEDRGDGNIPFSQLLPVHSIVQFICRRVLLFSAHVRQYFVLVVKILPEGTSGVEVDMVTDTAFSKSKQSRFSVMMHFVCLGPIGALSGLM